MATQKPTLSVPVQEFLAALLRENSVHGRAAVVASQFEQNFPGGAIAVYRFDDTGQAWMLAAFVGDARPENLVRGGMLEGAPQLASATVLSAGRLRLEQYAHLGISRHIESLACVPLFHGGRVMAAVEIASFDRVVDEREFVAMSDVIEHAAVALATAAAYESERNSNYDSITRLTQLYDLERTFNSTLEMDKLLNIVPAKIREILPCAAVNLWMVQDDDVVLSGRSGSDPSTAIGDVQKSGEGLAAAIADSGKAIAILNPDDPRLQARRGTHHSPQSLLAVPIVEQEFLVGVIEAVDRADGQPFNDDDLFFLTTISQTTASALHNASLLEAERKVEILETLVGVSREITSTLNLDRVLQVVVNAPQRIMSYDRAAIALDQKGKLQVRAISGKTEFAQNEPAVRTLADILEFCAVSNDELYVTAPKNRVDSDREETRIKFAEYFKQTGSRGFYAVPLADDEGRLGILSFESKDPTFLSGAHLEMSKVLAAQATVALRNASLYTEVPFISVLEPLLQKKQQFMRLEKRRRVTYGALAAVAALLLVLVPFPMRVGGTAVVAPQRSAKIQTPFDGVIRRVLVRESDTVAPGTVIAELDDWDTRTTLASDQAKYEQALSQMNRALATSDSAEAGMQRVQVDYWQSEVARQRERLERTKLRSPIAGVVTTPHIEDMAGRKLDAGDTIAEIVDTSHASVDIAVDQDDMPLIHAADPAVLKLEGFPSRRFRGDVEIVSPIGTADGDSRVFMARVNVANSDRAIRAGMQGYGKVFTSWRPAGYVMFRGLAIWVWTKLWLWFGW